MSRIRANQITNQSADGAPTVQNGLVISGVTTSTTFSGSGASLTNIPSAQLTGALPAIDGSNLTGISAGTALSGSTDNTVCTVTGANAIQGESGLTYNGTRLDVTTGDLQVIGGEGGDAEIRIVADQGDDGSDYWRFQSAASNNKLKLASYASGSWVDKVNVDTSGNLEVVGGNLVIGTSGNGVDFSAAGDAGGMTSELLDDYEEGTFTPTISGPTSISYSEQYGRYVKIGKLVTVNVRIQFSGTSSSGYFKIQGLPFAGASGTGETYGSGGITYCNVPLSTVNYDPYIGTSSTDIQFYQKNSGGNITLSSNCSNAYMGLAAFYYV